jgi:phage tail protein X
LRLSVHGYVVLFFNAPPPPIFLIGSGGIFYWRIWFIYRACTCSIIVHLCCMRYGSVCSGIEAATRAWHGLGWEPAFFSEIEKFPSAVLAHHYGSNMPGEELSGNGVPNLGDMTRFQEWPDYAVDVLVGGTPLPELQRCGTAPRIG